MCIRTLELHYCYCVRKRGRARGPRKVRKRTHGTVARRKIGKIIRALPSIHNRNIIDFSWSSLLVLFLLHHHQNSTIVFIRYSYSSSSSLHNSIRNPLSVSLLLLILCTRPKPDTMPMIFTIDAPLHNIFEKTPREEIQKVDSNSRTG